MSRDVTPDEVVAFWREAGLKKWFARDEAFDDECRRGFHSSWEKAGRGELSEWEKSAAGALALILLLDQMPRNMFRGDPKTWSTDPQALAVAERALDKGFDMKVDPALRPFVYLPFEHAEDRKAQQRSLKLFAILGAEEQMRYARHHHDVVMKFGRFPHRNAVLGRESTPEELAFLEEDDFRG